jgi:hypothetical protein
MPPVSAGDKVLDTLARDKAILLLDEHGHVFNHMGRKQIAALFPYLLPNTFVSHTAIRLVFAGSDHSAFEVQLNGTYLQCLHFVQPLTDDEARLLVESRGGAPLPVRDNLYRTLANNVPRMVVVLLRFLQAAIASKKGGTLDQVAENEWVVSMAADMERVLRNKLQDRDHDFKLATYEALDQLFHLSCMGAVISWFLDVGYIFRLDSMHAAPLCMPATIALLNIWEYLGGQLESKGDLKTRLQAVVRAGSAGGRAFELLIWQAVLVRGYGRDGLRMPLRPIGSSPMPAKELQAVFIADLHRHESSALKFKTGTKHSDIVTELQNKMEEAKRMRLNTIVRLGEGASDLDFVLLQHTGEYIGIQTSVSDFGVHSGGVPTLTDIQTRWTDRGIPLKYFIYITTSTSDLPPPMYPAVRKLRSIIRIVHAQEWLGL